MIWKSKLSIEGPKTSCELLLDFAKVCVIIMFTWVFTIWWNKKELSKRQHRQKNKKRVWIWSRLWHRQPEKIAMECLGKKIKIWIKNKKDKTSKKRTNKRKKRKKKRNDEQESRMNDKPESNLNDEPESSLNDEPESNEKTTPKILRKFQYNHFTLHLHTVASNCCVVGNFARKGWILRAWRLADRIGYQFASYWKSKI